jgi:GntR family transcriptional regulator
VELEIDMRSSVPSWRQLADKLTAAIESGEYAPDDPIPSLRRLHEETGLAQSTIQHALKELHERGLTYSVPGRGTFVKGKS